MIKLHESNIIEYLKTVKAFKNIDCKSVKVREITENTNVNYVYEVILNSPEHPKIYLKQAFDYVKIKPDFPAPLDRQNYEKKTITYLQTYWKGRIPEIVFYDNKNNVLGITDVGKDAKLLANEIKNGNLHFQIGTDLGKMMAKLHVPTYDENSYPVRDKKANDEHVNFIFDFRLRGSREEAPEQTEKLFQKSMGAKTSMIYGDWASKNVFVTGNEVRLVDFENLVRFDPSFDIGYALAHWVLDVSRENIKKMTKFFEDFEKAYTAEWKDDYKKAFNGILERASNYIGAMMLHRLVGIKNTNRMGEYLSREVPLIDFAKGIVGTSSPSPATALKSIKFP